MYKIDSTDKQLIISNNESKTLIDELVKIFCQIDKETTGDYYSLNKLSKQYPYITNFYLMLCKNSKKK